MTHRRYAEVYFYFICDETLAPVYVSWRKGETLRESFRGRLLGDGCRVLQSAAAKGISAHPRGNVHAKFVRGSDVSIFFFFNELLPWRRLQWGGGGVMATDYLVRQTPREVLLCPCVSEFSSQIFTASFRGAESFRPSSGSFTLHLHPSDQRL